MRENMIKFFQLEVDFMMSFYELSQRFIALKENIEKEFLSKRKSITFDAYKREMASSSVDDSFNMIKTARETCEIDDNIIYMRDLIAYFHSYFADAVTGYSTMKFGELLGSSVDENGFITRTYKLEYDQLDARYNVKKYLDAGADVKVLYFPICKDDDEESLLQLCANALTKGLRLAPIYYDDNTREECGFGELNPVYYDVDDLYNQLFSIGELAVLYSYRPEPDVIAMLIRAGADFNVHTSENPEGIPALAQVFQKDFEAEFGFKKSVLGAYREVYLNDHNKLTDEQRGKIVRTLWECVKDCGYYSQNVSQEDKEYISEALSEMTKTRHQQHSKSFEKNSTKIHE